jgi:hypothetical protein
VVQATILQAVFYKIPIMPVCAVYGCNNSTNINRKQKGAPDDSKVTVTKISFYSFPEDGSLSFLVLSFLLVPHIKVVPLLDLHQPQIPFANILIYLVNNWLHLITF